MRCSRARNATELKVVAPMRRRLAFAVVVAWLIAVTALAHAPNPLPRRRRRVQRPPSAGRRRPCREPSIRTCRHGLPRVRTSTAYGFVTVDRSAGAGDDAVATTGGLFGLTTNTTYHFRVIATNAAGIGRSTDCTLRTTRAAQPLAPLVSTGAIRDRAARSVTSAARSTRAARRRATGSTTARARAATGRRRWWPRARRRPRRSYVAKRMYARSSKDSCPVRTPFVEGCRPILSGSRARSCWR